MDDFPRSEVFRADARRDFAEFYRRANPDDAGLMDGLVLAHAAVVVGINTPREALDKPTRADLERKLNAVEQSFSALRERVRQCPTFLGLTIGDQLQIERVIFVVGPPVSG